MKILIWTGLWLNVFGGISNLFPPYSDWTAFWLIGHGLCIWYILSILKKRGG